MHAGLPFLLRLRDPVDKLPIRPETQADLDVADRTEEKTVWLGAGQAGDEYAEEEEGKPVADRGEHFWSRKLAKMSQDEPRLLGFAHRDLIKQAMSQMLGGGSMTDWFVKVFLDMHLMANTTIHPDLASLLDAAEAGQVAGLRSALVAKMPSADRHLCPLEELMTRRSACAKAQGGRAETKRTPMGEMSKHGSSTKPSVICVLSKPTNNVMKLNPPRRIGGLPIVQSTIARPLQDTATMALIRNAKPAWAEFLTWARVDAASVRSFWYLWQMDEVGLQEATRIMSDP